MTIWLLNGLWILLGCAEAAHLITIMTNRSLQTYITLCGSFSFAGIFVYAVLFGWWFRKHKRYRTERMGFSPLILLFAALAGVTLHRLWENYTPNLDDAVYEIVIGNLSSGRLMLEHPFLGGTTDQAMPLRFQILGLSSLYSALITVSQQSQYIVMCKLVPTVVWLCSMLVYRLFALYLFKGNAHKCWMFVSVVAYLYLITGELAQTAGFRLFYAGFSGEAVRALVLLPYTVYVSLKGKWLYAVLAVLAEACMVWTTYGFGYCALAAGCIFAVRFWMSRRKQHAV